MKNLIGNLLIIAGIVGGLYIGGWCMFIKPIIEACRAFDTGTLTGMIVGITVLKCIFAGFIGTIVSRICGFIGIALKVM